MSQFSEAFSASFSTAVSVFGDTCKINGATHPCIIHDLNSTNLVIGNRPGRSQEAGGTIVVSATAWATARGKKGNRVVIGGDTFRISNDPDVGFTSDTVTLVLAPLT
jgi:hypothetical protein